MATLVLGAIGTLIGGPVGGAVGSLIGNRIDGEAFAPGARSGPRLKELSVTTSSYGQPIPVHIGRVRAPGTIIWATDLKEESETSGGKGRPKTTTYSYSMSFAVLLSSNPIDAVGRIWADGNLLRGERGDLKAGGQLRVHHGRPDQTVDPLLAAATENRCPAYRGCAYAVFEDLQLAEFGNRIPALTFELVGGDGARTVAMLGDAAGVEAGPDTRLPLVSGYSNEGSSLADNLTLLDMIEPLTLDIRGERAALVRPRPSATALPVDPAIWNDGEFGARDGVRADRGRSESRSLGGLRYYDVERDYLPGLQRRPRRARNGDNRLLELPVTLTPGSARRIVERLATREEAGRERLHYRVPELDPAIGPGTVLRVPDRPGLWFVEAWEWREQGVEYELSRYRLADSEMGGDGADPGDPWQPRDRLPAPSMLEVFELPAASDTAGSLYAAIGASTGRWAGATVYAERGDTLMPLSTAPVRRAVMGHLASALGPSRALLFEAASSVVVELADHDAQLADASLLDIANGANRVLIGDEIVQYERAAPLGEGRWRLEGLLRGRGGTEWAAADGHAPLARFVLLDDRLVDLGAARSGTDERFAVLGLADEEPVMADHTMRGAALRPPMPVHGRAALAADGTLSLSWVRRARGAWLWRDGVAVPLVEEIERYEIGVGPVGAPLLLDVTGNSSHSIGADRSAGLAGRGLPVWVRQVGSHAVSRALRLFVL